MPKKKSLELVRLSPETIGERFHRAYKMGRRAHGFTYRTLASKVSEFQPIADATITRWEETLNVYDINEVPRTTRVKMFYCLLALGVDPGDFGLDEGEIGINLQVAKTARDVLVPGSRCYAESAA